MASTKERRVARRTTKEHPSSRLTRRDPTTPLGWIEAVRRGLPASAVAEVTRSFGLTQAELASATGIPQRTLVRRKREGTLSLDESAKLYRLSRILERAHAVFEAHDAALDWLKTPNRSLRNETPLSLLDTEIGAEIVLDTLGRIEHGVFS